MQLSTNPQYLDAMTSLFRGEYCLAREKLRACLTNASDNIWQAFFYRAIADSYTQEGSLDEALQAFSDAVRVDPSPLSLLKQAEFVISQFDDADSASALFAAAFEKGKNYSDETFSYVVFRRQTLDAMRKLGLGDRYRQEEDSGSNGS